MYKSFYGLKANPFNVNPDPRFMYLTAHTREALACLVYAISKRKGFVVLTGEVGTGKTTLINKFLAWLRSQRVSTAFIFNPKLSTMEFLRYMVADFGIAGQFRDKADLLLALNSWLLERYRNGETAVLIVDEAHCLSPELLEEIRLLTNLETATEKLLHIVLSGQPELEAKLKLPELRQLRQRITLRCRTHPLTQEETSEYIAQRLRIAGGNGQPIFSSEAMHAVYKYAGGIPRITNLLCEHALISGFVDQQRPIKPETVDVIAREFELDEEFEMIARQSGENVTLSEALSWIDVRRERQEAMQSKEKLR